MSRQIALADVLLVNKMDLISTEENKMTTLEQRLRALNPTAPLIQTTHGRVDLAQVLNIGAYRTFKPDDTSTSHLPHDHGHNHDHDHTAECHQHDLESISSVQLKVPSLSDAQLVKLDEWIRSVLWEKKLPGDTTETPGLEVLRCKGIYHTTDGKSYILQGVQILYDVTEVPERDSEGAAGDGKLVFIGRGLSEATMSNLKQHLGV